MYTARGKKKLRPAGLEPALEPWTGSLYPTQLFLLGYLSLFVVIHPNAFRRINPL